MGMFHQNAQEGGDKKNPIEHKETPLEGNIWNLCLQALSSNMALLPCNTPCRSLAKLGTENCKTQPEPQRDFNFFSWTTIRNMDKKGRLLGLEELCFTFCANFLMRTHSINCVFWTRKLRGSHWIHIRILDLYDYSLYLTVTLLFDMCFNMSLGIFIRGNLGSKMGLIRKCSSNKFCELEFTNQ